MHNKIHSVISPLFRIKNADTETGWNVQILRSVWIISAEIRYLLSEQKKFQNKSKNIDEVYQSVFFRCIMFLSYKVTFLCNVLGQIHYTSESPVRYFFYEKVVKWCTNYYFTSVKGKKFSFSAGSSNKVKVDLVHKGTIVQTVVSSWTISAGGSKSHTITADDLGGYSNSDKFYFRFNSSPIGNRYSISGYFG